MTALCTALCYSLNVAYRTNSALLSLPPSLSLSLSLRPLDAVPVNSVIHSCAAEDLELDLERELEEPPPELAPPADQSQGHEISPGQVRCADTDTTGTGQMC